MPKGSLNSTHFHLFTAFTVTEFCESQNTKQLIVYKNPQFTDMPKCFFENTPTKYNECLYEICSKM